MPIRERFPKIRKHRLIARPRAATVVEPLEGRLFLSGTPAPPTAFTTAPASDSEVDLTWQESDPSTAGFVIQRSLVSDFSQINAMFTAAGASRSFQDTTVAPVTQYYYEVIATSAAGNSSPAVAGALTPDHSPSGLATAAVTTREVDLQWREQNLLPVTSFSVERATGDGPFFAVAQVAGTKRAYTDNIDPGTFARYRVREMGADGVSGYSNLATAVTPPANLSLGLNFASLGTSPVFDPGHSFRVVESNGIGYFVPEAGPGDALWRTDGTPAGTYRVGASGIGPSDLTDANGTLYFATMQGLFKFDGTASAPVRVTTSTPDVNIDQLTYFNGSLYFMQKTSTGGRGLWKSDGTAVGTILIKDFGPGDTSRESIVVSGDRMYLAAPSETGDPSDVALWISDGTATGTTRVAATTPGNPHGLIKFFVIHGVVYLTANDGIHDTPGLWTTDGTPAGTVELLDGSVARLDLNDFQPAALGSTAYFLAASGTNETMHLWSTDGTPSGTQPVADVGAPFEAADGIMEHRVVTVGGKLIFATSPDGQHQIAVWTSDGTPAGTVQLLTITSDTVDDQRVGVFGLSIVNGAAYFSAEQASVGWEVFRSDGTAAGTQPLASFPANLDPPSDFSALGQYVTFSATSDPSQGLQLWQTDGTSAGTHALTSVVPSLQQIMPEGVTAAGEDAFYFTGPLGDDPQDLWRTDGTPTGTVHLWHGFEGLDPLYANNRLFFLDIPSGTLWESNGTVAGTIPVPGLPRVTELVSVLGRTILMLVYNPRTQLYEWWNTDGITSTRQLVTTVGVLSTPVVQSPSGAVYFIGQANAESGWEVFRTDPTSGATVQLTSLNNGPAGASPSGLVDVNGTIFFQARDSSGGLRLWGTDGTPAGTIPLSPQLNSIGPIASVNGTAFFAATDGLHSNTLWKSNGTPAGTMLVGPAAVAPQSIVDVKGAAVFATTGAGGNVNAIWRSDGTAAGTVMVRPVTGNSNPPFQLVSSGSVGFYYDAVQLWETDGTTLGTHAIDPDLPSYPPPNVWLNQHVTVAGDRVYYAGGGNVNGSPVSLRFATLEPLRGPTDLAAQSTQPTGNTPGAVTLSWTSHSPGAPGFIIERSVSSDFSTLDGEFFAPASSNAFTDTSPTAAPILYYRVRAVDAGGQSDPSNTVSASFGVIRGVVFFDTNYNGVYDPSGHDTPAYNITVYIDSNGNAQLDPGEMRTSTDITGVYQFGGLAPGNYLVRAILNNPNYVWSEPLRGAAITPVVTGQSTIGPDFGMVWPSWPVLNFNYLLTLAQHYGQDGTIADGDLNNDGRIDFNDLLLLAQNYGHQLSATTPADSLSVLATAAKRRRLTAAR